MTLSFFTGFLFVVLCAKNKAHFPQMLLLSPLSQMIQKKKKVEGSFTGFLQEKEAFQGEERQRQVKTQIHAKEREA